MEALNVRIHDSQTVLAVTWRHPAVIRNPIAYRIRYHKTPSGNWSIPRIFSSRQTQYNITGVEEGADYEVEVWAIFLNIEASRRRATIRLASEIFCTMYQPLSYCNLFSEILYFSIPCVVISCRPN